jgi:hypothetical protein
MTRRDLIKRALAALASVPVVGKCFGETMTRTPEEVATQTVRTLCELRQGGRVTAVYVGRGIKKVCQYFDPPIQVNDSRPVLSIKRNILTRMECPK